MAMEPDWIRDVLSPPRFAPYLAKAGGDTAAANFYALQLHI
jgi:hypothetical protein